MTSKSRGILKPVHQSAGHFLLKELQNIILLNSNWGTDASARALPSKTFQPKTNESRGIVFYFFRSTTKIRSNFFFLPGKQNKEKVHKIWVTFFLFLPSYTFGVFFFFLLLSFPRSTVTFLIESRWARRGERERSWAHVRERRQRRRGRDVRT